MATQTQTQTGIAFDEIDWVSAAIAGIIATVAFGAMQHMAGQAAVIRGAMPAMYGLGPSLAIGWVIHLFHGVVLGLVYSVLVSLGPLREYSGQSVASIVLGVAYGVVTTIGLAWLLMPAWLSAIGFPNAPPLPNVGVTSLVGHVVYGVVLGVLYPVLGERL